ncbi:MAG TPA: energy transducer TonB [Steroidobacteraceae bacterium]|jgi:protein TonB|nr:energy transducer TonB [Steroidobacteraceae bacterium]
MAAYAQHDSSYFSRRAIAFVTIVCLHIVLIYGFATGLAHRMVVAIAPPIQTDIVQEVQKRDEPPPPPPPKMERPPVEVPPPDVAINVPSDENTTAIRDVTDRPVQAAPPPPPRAVVRTGAKLDVKHSPSTDDYYPPTSRRMGEQGTTTVSVCVTPEGKIAGEPKVQHTAGSSRLDEAAVKWAAHARFQPGTEDGKPVEGCTPFNVKFVLTD